MRRLAARLVASAYRRFRSVLSRLVGRGRRRPDDPASLRAKLFLSPMESRDHTGNLAGGMALAALGGHLSDPLEAMAIVTLGGLLGVLIGFAFTKGIGSLPLLGPLFKDESGTGDIQLRLSQFAVLTSTILLELIGLVAGLLPALTKESNRFYLQSRTHRGRLQSNILSRLACLSYHLVPFFLIKFTLLCEQQCVL